MPNDPATRPKVIVYMSPEDKRALKVAAAQADETMSDYAAVAVLAAVAADMLPGELQSAMHDRALEAGLSIHSWIMQTIREELAEDAKLRATLAARRAPSPRKATEAGQ